MNHFFLLLLSFVGGIALAMQGSVNAQLGTALKSPLLATVVAFFMSTLYALAVVSLTAESLPSSPQIKNIPLYFWFTGGLLSLIGLGLYYYTIPKLGIASVISIGLCGQLIFAVIAGHYGWLNLPVEPITLRKMTGMGSLMLGIILINFK